MNKMLLIHGVIFFLGVLISRECCNLKKTGKLKCSYQKTVSKRLESPTRIINHLDMDLPTVDSLLIPESIQATGFLFSVSNIYSSDFHLPLVRGPPLKNS